MLEIFKLKLNYRRYEEDMLETVYATHTAIKKNSLDFCFIFVFKLGTYSIGRFPGGAA